MVFSKAQILGGGVFKEEGFLISMVHVYTGSPSSVWRMFTARSDSHIGTNRAYIFQERAPYLFLNLVSWREKVLFWKQETEFLHEVFI